MAKTMWCETFNFARSLRCLQRQGLKCFERILLMFLILRLVDFFCKTGSELVNYSIREAIFDPVSKGSVDVWQCLHFSGRSLYLRPFHWRLGWLASCFRCFRCNLNFNRPVLFKSLVWGARWDSDTHMVRQAIWLWNIVKCESLQTRVRKIAKVSLYGYFSRLSYWYLLISASLCPTAVRQLSRWFVTFQALQVQESQPKVLFTDLPPLWFLPVKESPEDESYWVIDSIVKIAKARKARWVRGHWRN